MDEPGLEPLNSIDGSIKPSIPKNQRALMAAGLVFACLLVAVIVSQLANTPNDELSLSETNGTTSSLAQTQVANINEVRAPAAPTIPSSATTFIETPSTTFTEARSTTIAKTSTSSEATTTSTSPAVTVSQLLPSTLTSAIAITQRPTTTQAPRAPFVVAEEAIEEQVERVVEVIRNSRTTTTKQDTTTSKETTTTTGKPTTVKPKTTNAPVDAKTVWVENFNTLDRSKWSVENNSDYGISKEVQCYMADNVKVTGGKLVLKARKGGSGCGNRPTYSSGMIRGRAFSFSPGQVLEFRVKLTPASSTNQAGLFPAVWSSSWGGAGWPKGGEFDYLEVMTANNPTKPFFSMHYQKPDGRKGISNKFYKLGENFTNRWHTVRVEYRRGDLRWFIDGNFAHKVDDANTVQGWPAPFDRTIHDLKINLALAGNPGPLDPRALGSSGATFEMDYIKVSNL